MKIIRDDPAVDNVTGFTGGRQKAEQRDDVYHPQATRRTQRNAQQKLSTACVKLAERTGANLFLMAVQDIRVGGRQSNASFSPVHRCWSDDLAALREWELKIRKKLATLPELADVNSA